MYGHILIGGGRGAIIDHNKGTAYTYPTWIQLVFDKALVFDRTAQKQEDQPTPATNLAASPAQVVKSGVKPGNTAKPELVSSQVVKSRVKPVSTSKSGLAPAIKAEDGIAVNVLSYYLYSIKYKGYQRFYF